jgi:hypothetical protein
MKGSFERIFYYEDLLPDPFQRIRRVPCLSGLLFFTSTGVSSGLNGTRTAEQRTPQDARTTQEAQVRSFPNIISHLQEQSLHFARVGYLRLSRPQQFFGREITSLLLLLYRLSLSRILSCVCVIWDSNLFLTILFVNPTPVNLELRFNSIPFVSRSHRSLYKYRRRLAGISFLVQIYFVRYRSGPFIEFFCLFVAIIFGFGHIEQ